MTTPLNYNDMLSAYRQYPAPIRPYLLRAETHPGIRSIMTKSFLRVFVDILSRAPIAEPERPIKVRVDSVAARLELSAKTVSRTLQLMKSNFWLSPAPAHDGRNNYGEFAAREFIIEAPLRHMLGLPAAPQPRPLGSDASKTPACPASPPLPPLEPLELDSTEGPHESPALGLRSVDNSSFETKLSDGVIKGVNKVFLKVASFKDAEGGKTSVPQDLAPLHTELGISILGICSLMALAKKTGQRLQDVWHAKREVILNSGAREGRAVQYFRSLLKCGEDFAYIARCRAPSGAPSASSSSGKPTTGMNQTMTTCRTGDDLKAIALACRFKKFVHIKMGMTVRFFDGTAEVRRDDQVEFYASEQLTGLYRGISNGNLRMVQE